MNSIILTLVQGIVVLIIAPFCVGFVRWCKARLQTRKGPSPFLPYWSFATLLRKKMTVTRYRSWVFDLVPHVVLASVCILAFVIPTLITGGILGAYSNIIWVAALLAIGALFLVLGGMDVASAFGAMGASREMTLAAFTEPIILTVFATLGFRVHAWSLDAIVAGLGHTPFLVGVPVLIVTALAFLFVLLAENARYPVDNPATHLELTMVHEAMILEYSGPYLAMVEYASAVKLTVLSLLFVNIVFPVGLLTTMTVTGLAIGILWVIVKLVIVMGFIACIESFMAKMRFYRMQEYMTTAYVLAIVGFVISLIA